MENSHGELQRLLAEHQAAMSEFDRVVKKPIIEAAYREAVRLSGLEPYSLLMADTQNLIAVYDKVMAVNPAFTEYYRGASATAAMLHEIAHSTLFPDLQRAGQWIHNKLPTAVPMLIAASSVASYFMHQDFLPGLLSSTALCTSAHLTISALLQRIELECDRKAAEWQGSAEPLIEALQATEAPRNTSFMPGIKNWVMSWFEVHPPTESRIAELREWQAQRDRETQKD